MDARKDQTQNIAFNTFNPTSQPEYFAGLVLFRICDDSGCWLQVRDAWRAGMIPQGEFVLHATTGKPYCVEKTCKVACCVWPAVMLELGLWTKDLKFDGLEWVTVFDLDEWRHIPTEDSSPLHLYTLDSFGMTYRMIHPSFVHFHITEISIFRNV